MSNPTQFPRFYMTADAPCPYLPGRFEKKVFTHLLGQEAQYLNNTLTHAGFRRSQNILYRPACEACNQCVSVRIRVDGFQHGPALRRIARRNARLQRTLKPARAQQEHFSLLRSYIDARHPKGGMASITSLDYTAMVEDTAIKTMVLEYRTPGTAVPDANRAGTRTPHTDSLVAVALTDRLADGLSMVYSFFDPALSRDSPGTYLVMDHVALARAEGLPYVYLGYWIEGSPKMAYKSRFRPLEALGPDGWEEWSPER